jgi:hypothetical protein
MDAEIPAPPAVNAAPAPPLRRVFFTTSHASVEIKPATAARKLRLTHHRLARCNLALTLSAPDRHGISVTDTNIVARYDDVSRNDTEALPLILTELPGR